MIAMYRISYTNLSQFLLAFQKGEPPSGNPETVCPYCPSVDGGDQLDYLECTKLCNLQRVLEHFREILSKSFPLLVCNASVQEREQFLKMHIKDNDSSAFRMQLKATSRAVGLLDCESQDSNGIMWFELQRELESIYYQRIDYYTDADLAC